LKKYTFPSVIYSGFDYPPDDIGNLIPLLDRLVFDSIPVSKKSLHALTAPLDDHPPYGLVPAYSHLDRKSDFQNCLYLDVSRNMSDPGQIEQSCQRAITHKYTFNAVTALYLMWESDRLSPTLEALPGVFDFVIITSNFLDGYLSDRNINFCHLPHPYDYAKSCEAPTPAERKITVFGISCGLWSRKNVSLLAQVFADSFGDNPNYILRIHTRFDTKLADFTTEQKQLADLLDKHENIELESRSLSREEYILWMSSLDLYCFISSGEGYSITPREALHLGIPTILLDAHVHCEFSHLPGVIKVAECGKKPSIPAQHRSHLSQGSDWKVDKQSLKDALLFGAEHHRELRECLKSNHSEVVEFHDVRRIKQNWISELSQQYDHHIGKDSQLIPLNLLFDRQKHQMESAPGEMDIQDQMCDPLPIGNTGENTNKGIFCFSSKHHAGHCAYGHNLVPQESSGMKVQFFIDILNSAINDIPLVNLEVYDNKADEIICLETYSAEQLLLKPDDLSMHFSANRNQSLEFRVYWHGTGDIWLHNIKLQQDANPTS
jgi:glycosyltransferase involved in cell wall biosynthesis